MQVGSNLRQHQGKRERNNKKKKHTHGHRKRTAATPPATAATATPPATAVATHQKLLFVAEGKRGAGSLVSWRRVPPAQKLKEEAATNHPSNKLCTAWPKRSQSTHNTHTQNKPRDKGLFFARHSKTVPNPIALLLVRTFEVVRDEVHVGNLVAQCDIPSKLQHAKHCNCKQIPGRLLHRQRHRHTDRDTDTQRRNKQAQRGITV